MIPIIAKVLLIEIEIFLQITKFLCKTILLISSKNVLSKTSNISPLKFTFLLIIICLKQQMTYENFKILGRDLKSRYFSQLCKRVSLSSAKNVLRKIFFCIIQLSFDSHCNQTSNRAVKTLKLKQILILFLFKSLEN